MMTPAYSYGFRVLDGKHGPRRSIDAGAALAAYAACDERAELHREAYLSAFTFGPDFRDYLKSTGSTAGFAGPCFAVWLWFDIDREADLPRALEDARRLATALTDPLGIAEDDVLAFLSGGKGFHLGIPTSVMAHGDSDDARVCVPGADFHRVARRFAEGIAERAGVLIDIGIYAKVQLFRAPNSRHPRTGLHKRRLAFDEVMHLSADRIIQLAATPEPFELPMPSYRSDAAAELWTEAANHVHQEAEAAAERHRRILSGEAPCRLNRATLEFIRHGADAGGQGDAADRATGAGRHRRLFSASKNLAELGAPESLCFALLEESALDCGLPPADVRRCIENGWAAAHRTLAEAEEGDA